MGRIETQELGGAKGALKLSWANELPFKVAGTAEATVASASDCAEVHNRAHTSLSLNMQSASIGPSPDSRQTPPAASSPASDRSGAASSGTASLAFKLLVLMLALTASLAFSAHPAYADTDNDNVMTFYNSDFVDNTFTIYDGGTYVLGEDIEDGRIVVNGNDFNNAITLDLNGHTLNNVTSKRPALTVCPSDYYKRVTLDVVSSGSKGSIVQGKDTGTVAVRIDTEFEAPTVNLGKIRLVSEAHGGQCVACYQGSLTIDGATLQTADGTDAELIYAYNTSNMSNVITLKSGNFLADSGASGLFKLESSGKYALPMVIMEGGTYSHAPVAGTLGKNKSIWKTEDGFVIGDSSDMPSRYKNLVVPSKTGGIWFASDKEAVQFARERAATSGTAYRAVSFASGSEQIDLNIPTEYIADGLCAVEPAKPSTEHGKFLNWKNGSEAYDFTSAVTSDLTLTANWNLYVARVGNYKSFTVEDAVNMAASDETVELLQNVTSRVYLKGYSRAVTIDLKGHTIKNFEAGKQAIMVESPTTNEALTITDSGNAAGKKGAIIQAASTEAAIRVDSDSGKVPRLVLNGVELKTLNSECLQLYKGTAELTDVTMSSKEKANSLVYVQSNGGVNVNSGTYTAADGATLITEVNKGVSSAAETRLIGGKFSIFPADGTLAEGKALFKHADSADAKGYYEIVNAEAPDTTSVEVEYAGAKIYFESLVEAQAFIESHSGATTKKYVTAVIAAPKNCVYDGTAKEAEVKLVGVDDGDDVSAVIEYKQGDEAVDAACNAGAYTAFVTKLTGEQAEKYVLSGSPSLDFEISKAKANIKVKAPGQKTIGDAPFKLEATASTDAELQYASSDTRVATVDEDGQVIVHAAGTTTLTVSAEEAGNYKEGEASVELKVAAPGSLSTAKVMLSKDSYVYNGKVKKPKVKLVILGDKVLKSGTDYTATVASGKKVGTYKVTITAKGNYTGKATASYVINPKGIAKFKVSKAKVKTKFGVTTAKKSFKAKWKKSKAQRSGVQLRYSIKKSMARAKTVKVKGASAKAKTVKKLKSAKKYYVQARAYKVVKGKTYYSKWSTKKVVKTK